jgi:hypothetical protein
VLGLGWDVEGEMDDAEEEVSCCGTGSFVVGRLVLVLVGEMILSDVDRRLMEGRWNAPSPFKVALGSWGEAGVGRDWSSRSDANGKKLGESSSSSSV